MTSCDSKNNREISILLTTKETEYSLGVGTTTVYKWCKEGKLTPIKFGPRCTRFRLSEIQALIDAHAVPRDLEVSNG